MEKCPRCGGQMILESWPRYAEWLCIQCGKRLETGQIKRRAATNPPPTARVNWP